MVLVLISLRYGFLRRALEATMLHFYLSIKYMCV